MSKNNYGGAIRTRVCGILIQHNKILLLNHPKINAGKDLWLPPGGRAEYNSSLPENLQREIKEETNLYAEIGRFLFLHEYIDKPLHAIETFFLANILSGTLALGTDPELAENEQIITDMDFFDFEKINSWPRHAKHNIFNYCKSLSGLLALSGYFKN